MNPAMMESMAHSKMADLRQAAERRSGARYRSVALEGAGGSAISTGRDRPETDRPETVRRAIGWFLVGVGLRLAVPRRNAAAAL
jgi:hypothetical protein